MSAKILKTKNLLFVCILLLLLYMFLEPQRSLEASQRGLLLWLDRKSTRLNSSHA